MLKANNLAFIRCLLAAIVIVGHSFPLSGTSSFGEPLYAATHGRVGCSELAVDGFFIISGFLIANSWQRRRSAREYARKRFFRIVPGFLVATLICTFVVIPIASGGFGPFRAHFLPDKFLASILLIREYKQRGIFTDIPFAGAVNGSLWTIQIECWCYALTPVLLLISGLYRRWIGLAAFGLVLISNWWFQKWAHLFPSFGFVSYVMGDLAEWPRMLCYFFAGTTFFAWRDRIPYRAWMAVAALALVAASTFYPNALALTLPVAGTYLLFFMAFEPSSKLKNFDRFGDFSYGIYLYGFPIQQLAVSFLHLENSPYRLMLVALPAAIIAGILSWHGVEKRFLRSAKQAAAEPISPDKPLCLLFLYNTEWSHEINDFGMGLVPSHRLFGLAEMKAMGHHASACPRPWWWSNLLGTAYLWRLYQAIQAAIHSRQLDAVVATHEAAAFPLLFLKKLGIPTAPVIVLNSSLLRSRNRTGFRGMILRRLLPEADMIVCYASEQIARIEKEFLVDPARICFIPLGVDVSYFGELARGGLPVIVTEMEPVIFPDCLSAGTNEGKDFPTLLSALPAELRLTIVTDAYNESVISNSDAAAVSEGRVSVLHDLNISNLRDLYRGAGVIVIPLRDMHWSSGQTVMLENMALGNQVIVTNVAATRDYVCDGETAWLVRPGDVDHLRERIQYALADSQEARQVGFNAAEKVRSSFTARKTAERLVDEIRTINTRRRTSA